MAKRKAVQTRICPKCGGCGETMPWEAESPACSECHGTGEVPARSEVQDED